MNHRRAGNMVFPFFILGFGLMLLAAPGAVAAGFAGGLELCVRSVLPALFPFFVVCNLLVASPYSFLLGVPLRPLARLLGVKSRLAPLILALSWLGGYAVGMQMVSRCRAEGRLSERGAVQLSMLGFCSSPGFVVGCVGGLLLHNVLLGWVLYFLQIAANLLCCALFWPWVCAHFSDGPQSAPAPEHTAGGSGFAAAITGAVNSSLCVAGCVLFFRILGGVVLYFVPLPAVFAPYWSGFLEISAGCAAFAGAGGRTALFGVCFCLSWPGLSVLAQLQVLARGQVPLGVHMVLYRLLHIGVLYGAIRFTAAFFPAAADVFSSLAPRVVVMNRTAPDAAFLVFAFLCAVIYKADKNFHCNAGQKLYNYNENFWMACGKGGNNHV